MKSFFALILSLLTFLVADQSQAEKIPFQEGFDLCPAPIAGQATVSLEEILVINCDQAAPAGYQVHTFATVCDRLSLTALDPLGAEADYPPLTSEKAMEGHRAREIYNSGAGGLACLC